MSAQFITLEEAAKKLGVHTDELVEMRSRGDIFGYRDGASWKFKPEDVDALMEAQNDARLELESSAGTLPREGLHRHRRNHRLHDRQKKEGADFAYNGDYGYEPTADSARTPGHRESPITASALAGREPPQRRRRR